MRPVVRLALRETLAEFGADRCPDLDVHETRLRRIYGAFPAWPCDAQLAMHLLGWLHGPGFHEPALRRALCRPLPDFGAAATAGVRNRGHAGVVALADRVVRAWRNADLVLRWNLDPDLLYYPMGLA